MQWKLRPRDSWPWGIVRVLLIWDGKFVAWTRLLPITQPWMFKIIYEYSMVWSYSLKWIFFFVFPKKQSTKASVLYIDFPIKLSRGWLKMRSLKLNFWNLKPKEKLIILFYFHIWSYCCNQAGKDLL